MLRAVRRVAGGLVLTVVVSGVVGCGGDARGEEAYATKVAVYVGVPLRGPWGAQGQAIAAGVELGLADSGGGAGNYSVRVSEQDVTDDDGKAVTAQGASRVAGNFLRDVGTIGVIGGLSPTSTRQMRLVAGQVGAAFVTANGDHPAETTADLAPRGRRLSVDLAPSSRWIARGLVRRARAANCRRTTLIRSPGADPGTVEQLRALRAQQTLTVTTYEDPELRTGLARALRRGSDCVVLVANPSAGDPTKLLKPLARQLRGTTLLVSRGAASQGLAALVRAQRLDAEAIVDDPPAAMTPETRAIDADYRRVYGTPAPVGVMAGWRSIKLLLRAVADAGPTGGNRRDKVAQALIAAPIPAPPAAGRQRPDGTVTPTAVSVARATSYGWRAVGLLYLP